MDWYITFGIGTVLLSVAFCIACYGISLVKSKC